MVPTYLLCTAFLFVHSLLKEEGMLRTDRIATLSAVCIGLCYANVTR